MRATAKSTCDALGITAPPVTLHLKLLQGGTRSRLFVWSKTPADKACLQWLQETLRPTQLDMDHGGPNLLVADLEDGGWLTAPPLDEVTLDHIILEPNGTARLHLEGAKPPLEKLLKDLSHGQHQAELQSLREDEAPAGSSEGLITERQREVLSVAIEEGYYEIPRTITLRELAEILETSSATLSEILRRTERRLAEHYLEKDSPNSPPRGGGKHDEPDDPFF